MMWSNCCTGLTDTKIEKSSTATSGIKPRQEGLVTIESDLENCAVKRPQDYNEPDKQALMPQ